MHHLREISTFKFKHVEYLVFDEADRLFEMGVSNSNDCVFHYSLHAGCLQYIPLEERVIPL